MTKQSEKNKVEAQSQEKQNDNITKKCGIVMPIAAMDGYPETHWKDIKNILESAISEVDFEARMVNEADDIGVIHKRIVHNLYDNPMIVCDISGRNPNVMFELGLRLAFDKPTIIIKDEVTPYSFDTSSIEHLTYPKDLRYHKIEVFKEELKDRIDKTYKAYEKDPENYSTFLKNYGDFKTPIINEKTLPLDEYMLDEIKELRSSVSQLSKNLNRNNERYLDRKNHTLNFENNHTLTYINQTTKHIDDIYFEMSQMLDNDKVTVIKSSDTSIQVIGTKREGALEFFKRYITNQLSTLGYEVGEVEDKLYLIMD